MLKIDLLAGERGRGRWGAAQIAHAAVILCFRASGQCVQTKYGRSFHHASTIAACPVQAAQNGPPTKPTWS